MRVITFYSFKGGVGRTLACANFGKYLAKAGQKVVLVDMDLEAPGLDSKFFPDATTSISSGLLDQLIAFQDGSPLPGLSPIPIELPEEVVQAGGRLQLIPAGNYFDLSTYHRALSQLDWDLLLRTERGLAFWFDLLSRIENQFQPDVLVIDSRTGITEVGGLCTQVLPDTVLLLTSTSPESVRGTRRIHERITTSRLIKEGRGSRNKVDVRVVVTRIPREVKDFDALDRRVKLLLNLEVSRLYYLFADSDLAMSEYIAMDRPSGGEQSILMDYVDLFATLNPEDTVGYVKGRLAAFREGLTSRKELESRRVIQELLTLFPRSEVYLEAARYYRLVKDPEEAIANYLRYLQVAPKSKEVISEFADMCVAVPLGAIHDQRAAVVRYLGVLGAGHMDAPTLSLYCTLVKSPEQFQEIVTTIEGDPTKLTAQPFRRTLFRALAETQQWEKIVASATDIDLKDATMQLTLARAYAKLHLPEKALHIVHRMQLREPSEFLPVLEILYELRGDTDRNEIRKVFRDNRYWGAHMARYATGLLDSPVHPRRDDGAFRVWMRDLLDDMKNGQ